LGKPKLQQRTINEDWVDFLLSHSDLVICKLVIMSYSSNKNQINYSY
jgi:hypothetical protein